MTLVTCSSISKDSLSWFKEIIKDFDFLIFKYRGTSLYWSRSGIQKECFSKQWHMNEGYFKSSFLQIITAIWQSHFFYHHSMTIAGNGITTHLFPFYFFFFLAYLIRKCFEMCLKTAWKISGVCKYHCEQTNCDGTNYLKNHY